MSSTNRQTKPKGHREERNPVQRNSQGFKKAGNEQYTEGAQKTYYIQHSTREKGQQGWSNDDGMKINRERKKEMLIHQRGKASREQENLTEVTKRRERHHQDVQIKITQ